MLLNVLPLLGFVPFSGLPWVPSLPIGDGALDRVRPSGYTSSMLIERSCYHASLL